MRRHPMRRIALRATPCQNGKSPRSNDPLWSEYALVSGLEAGAARAAGFSGRPKPLTNRKKPGAVGICTGPDEIREIAPSSSLDSPRLVSFGRPSQHLRTTTRLLCGLQDLGRFRQAVDSQIFYSPLEKCIALSAAQMPVPLEAFSCLLTSWSVFVQNCVQVFRSLHLSFGARQSRGLAPLRRAAFAALERQRGSRFARPENGRGRAED